MLNGLWKLAWVETKVFVREPLGVLGSLGIPVVLFVVLGQAAESGPGEPTVATFNVAIMAALVIAIGAALSLISIMAIYREGGILKRLRATPLSPLTILAAHVIVKLGFTVVGMALLVTAGRQFFPGALQVNLVSLTAALLLSTLSILSLGFVIASVVPTARFAQPLGAAILYPMLAASGLFFPLDQLPTAARLVAQVLPTTQAVVLMQGIWEGAGWGAHWGSVAALLLVLIVCSALAAKLFRWE